MAVRGGGGHLKQQIKNRTATIKKAKIISQESVTDGNNLCKYTSLGFLLLWLEPRSSHVGKPSSLKDGQVVFPWILRFSPTFDKRLACYKQIILEIAVKPKSNKYTSIGSLQCVSIRYESIVNNLCLSKSIETTFKITVPII